MRRWRLAKTLSPALQAATSAFATTPGWLVEIAWDASTVSRFSSRGDQTFGGQVFLSGRLGKVAVDEAGGSLELMNGDLAAVALVLNRDTGAPCRIWKFYTDNPATADVDLRFEGITDAIDMSNPDRVRIELVADTQVTQRTISPATGFNHLSPIGRAITWGGQTFTLERA